MFCLCKHLVFVSTQSAREVQDGENVARKRDRFTPKKILFVNCMIQYFNAILRMIEK